MSSVKMNGSRIFLDFSAFFSGVRQQSCIYLDYEKCKCVQDVEEHIRRVFGVERRFHILNDGWLLPSTESSLLLRDNDTVSIVPEEDLKQSSKLSKKSEDAGQPHSANSVGNISSCAEVVVPKPPAAEDEAPLTNGSSQPSNEETRNVELPPSKSVMTNGSSLEKLTSCVKNPFASFSSSVPDTTVCVKESEPKNLGSNVQSVLPPSQEQLAESEHESRERKRKRIRRRKRKATSDTADEIVTEDKKLSPYIMNKYFQGVSHILKTAVPELNNKKHIFFRDEEEACKPLCKLSEKHTESKVDSTETVIPPENSSSNDPVGHLSKLMSLGNQKAPVVFERKKSESVGALKSKPEASKNQTSGFKLLPLDTMPVKETIIKFKILKMVNYSPTLSEVVTARVISPDFTTNQLYVQITEGLQELQSEKGKFSLDDDGEEDGDEKPLTEYVFLNWCDLIEPKAVECC